MNLSKEKIKECQFLNSLKVTIILMYMNICTVGKALQFRKRNVRGWALNSSST